jgi:hypothetical protein
MRNSTIFFILTIITLSLGLTSCELVGDIFEAGLWVGVIGVVVVVMLLFWIIRKIGGR